MKFTTEKPEEIINVSISRGYLLIDYLDSVDPISSGRIRFSLEEVNKFIIILTDKAEELRKKIIEDPVDL